jgi:cardiolipin synthase
MPRRFNLANLITGCRIALAPVLLFLAWDHREHAFLACLVVSLVSDIVDGQIARRLHLTSELGTRLDSWADLLTFASVPVALWWLRPDLVASERVAFLVTVGCYLVPILVGFLKFRRLTSYHTLMARISAYLMGLAVVVLFARGPTWILHVAVCVLLVAEVEEICITIALPELRSNVWSLRRVLRAGRAERPS